MRNTVASQVEQTAQVPSGQCGREESPCELHRFGDLPPEESNEDLLDHAWDDHTGESLDAKKVKEARQLEMEYYDKMHVFDKVPIDQCWERTGKAHLKARWVDIDKGTGYRSRWVAKQFKGSDSEEWFAATPPLEALRALISYTMSGPKKKALMVCDVSRAFVYAPVQHEIYAELCEEAKKTVVDNNMCAKLRMSMYGTKASAQNWHKKVQETMATFGFSIGKAAPVLFCHPQRSLKCLVHGDDFVVSGEPVDLVWMRSDLGVPAGNQHHNTWRRTRNVEGGDDPE